MGRLVALVAWGTCAGLYLYVMATARQRADARRHRCHLAPAPPHVDVVQRLADLAVLDAERICVAAAQVVADAERICTEATR